RPRLNAGATDRGLRCCFACAKKQEFLLERRAFDGFTELRAEKRAVTRLNLKRVPPLAGQPGTALGTTTIKQHNEKENLFHLL
ncbi:MAG: hypothetical protein QM648_06720, partial [Solirubrobacterales bacterium]